MSEKPDLQRLLDLYARAETVDQELFAEQRSNLLLVSGEHYNNMSNRYWDRIREARDLQPEQKLRLTKNHIGKISETYVNNIITYAPSVVATPNNEKENQDIKAAGLNNSVIQYSKTHDKWSDRVLEFAEDFVEVGEVACKLYFNPDAGEVKGEEPVTDEQGQPVVDEQTGQPKTKKVWTGAIVSERIYGFNLLRHPAAKMMIGEHYPLINRKMVDTSELQDKLRDQPQKLGFVSSTTDKTYKIFDAANGTYADVKDQTMVLEFFYPKCPAYPAGYFYIITEAGILWEGELPGGIFPIVYKGFKSVKTSPRHRSKIKQLRPYQVEINRTASKIAEHQITTGDVKLLVQSTSQISSGVQIPGVRSVKYTGAKPEFLPGQVGEQYVSYMTGQIGEMYQVAGVEEDSQEKPADTTGDMIQNIFRSIKQKKKFSLYIGKFESFCVDYWEKYLELGKFYFDQDTLIPMIGRTEVVNISEFKSTDKLCYQIKIEPQTDDLETQMGRTAMLSHILQYVGPQLDPKAIGQLIKQLPFGNWKKAFSELSREEDISDNFILALDRGQVPLPNKYDDAPYMIRRFVDRVLQADFAQLDPKIQKNYDTMISFYEKMEASKQAALQRAEAGFIPSGGTRVKAQIYIPSPTNPNHQELATFPTEALQWLMKRLADQGSSQEALSQVNQTAVAEIGGVLNQQQGSQVPPVTVDQGSDFANAYGQTNPGGPQ